MAGNRSYQDFEPVTEWKRGNESDTLLLYLPEFKKDQLRVQISSSGTLRISGERPIGGNKWTRFTKELSASSNCDTNKLTAKFQAGILSVRQPKRITPTENKPTAGSSEPKPKQDQPQPPQQTTPTELHKVGQPKPQKASQETAQSAKNQSDEPLKQETAKINTSLEKDKEPRITFGDLAKKETDADKVQETSGAKEENGKENEKAGKNKNRDDEVAENGNKKSLVNLGNQNRWISLVLVVLFSILVGLYLKNGKFFEGFEN
ncbi:protein RESTRICTED TEV MOVEMENT 2 [Impatiens glandulifera]|uniref:protein RESTRICTED TEV MOVEMENT 2 n=1 Tax=Impatiens glandulifera TaxID=253017 RepID=UPI001FB1A228|nr:protein RESTRICTED TEV MOVEMENT 2 [Impatiens glandulifera]